MTQTSHARADENDIEVLKAKLEALSELVASQANQIDNQAAQIEQLLAADTEVNDQTARVILAESNASVVVARQSLDFGRDPDDSIVRPGDFDGSVTFPGSTAAFKIGGFVRGDLSYDFDNVGAEEALNVRTIPLDGSADDETNNFHTSARSSRLNLDVRDGSPLGDLRVFVEMSFLGDGSETSNNFTPVLRHAAAQMGDFTFGQWWSYFSDSRASPETISGPLGTPLIRNPALRYRRNIDENWKLGIAIEDPAGDVSGPDSELGSDAIPNITGYLQYTDTWGRIRVSGVGLELASRTDTTYAGGINVSGRVNAPFLNPRDNVSFAGQFGSGISHYYATLRGGGLEAVVQDNGDINAIDVEGGFIAYQHWWSRHLRSTIQAGFLNIDDNGLLSAEDFNRGSSYSGNLFWSPVDNATFGVEYVYAQQEVTDGREGAASRLSMLARFDF